MKSDFQVLKNLSSSFQKTKLWYAAICFCLSISAFSFAQSQVFDWETAQTIPLDSVRAISFRKMKLTIIPEELARYKKLTYLDLGNNKLTHLPDFFSNFVELEILDLSKNKLDSFPEILFELTHLKRLILNRNRITYLPESLIKLQKLTYLDLWDNPLPDFPEALIKLPALKEFHVEGIQYGPKFQEKWRKTLPGVRLFFDPPCDCKE